MAKERMVTRTIKTSTVLAKVYNLITDEIENYTFDFSGEELTTERAEKLFKDLLKDTNYTFIKIVQINYVEAVYGMLEVDFIRLAQIIER